MVVDSALVAAAAAGEAAGAESRYTPVRFGRADRRLSGRSMGYSDFFASSVWVLRVDHPRIRTCRVPAGSICLLAGSRRLPV